MTAFNTAWALLKTPIWTDGMLDDPESPPPKHDPRFPKLMYNPLAMRLTPDIGRVWESSEGDARGHAQIQWDNNEVPFHQITDFELATEARGKGLSRERLREFIEELKDEDDWQWQSVPDELLEEPDETHVVQVEDGSVGFWDKMVREGLLDSASQYRSPRYTPEGELKPYIREKGGGNRN